MMDRVELVHLNLRDNLEEGMDISEGGGHQNNKLTNGTLFNNEERIEQLESERVVLNSKVVIVSQISYNGLTVNPFVR